MACSPIAAEHFKRMSSSPHSGKISRTDSPKEPEVESRKSSTARRSISHSFANATRQEVSNLMSAEEVEKPTMKIVIPTGDDTYSFRSAPEAATDNMVKNICNRQWKPVVNAMFLHEELREELLCSLAKHLAREMAAYTRSKSMLKFSTPSELPCFSSRKLVHEIKVFCPLWYTCITGAASVDSCDERKFDESINSLALVTSAIARLRNPRMSAHAKRISTVLVHSVAKAVDFTCLN